MSYLKQILKIILKHKLHLIFGVIFMGFYALFTVAPAWYMKNIVDALGAGDIPELKKFFWVGLGIILLFILKGISYFGQNYLMSTLGQRLIMELRQRLFSKVVQMPLTFFNKRSTGDLISRFTTDLITLNEAIYVSITGPLRDLPQIFMLLGLMLTRSWQLFLVTFLLLPPAAFMIGKFGQQSKKVTRKRLDKYGELSTLLNESITGIRIVKAFNMEKYEAERFQIENKRLYHFFQHTIRIASYSYPILELIGGICGAVILTYGGYLIIHNQITGGDFASFIIAFFMLNEPIKKFNGFTLKMQEGNAAAQRIFSILDMDQKIEDKPGALELPIIQKQIEVNIQKFSYEHDPVLNDINITLKAGTITALVGASGSGKSTLANLIPRFYDVSPGSGGIYIDGHDLRDVTLGSLRNQIAIVTQEIVLFNDTVASNISYGNINCSRELIESASKAGHAYEFINKLPDGFDQQIGEKGVRLSGGQRQRISISRALIKDAPILILDEATSALDTESEKEVQAAIENLMKNRTTLVIAHRLSTIQYADTIHVMKEGRIIESGTHHELLQTGGEYQKLYELQFQDPKEN